MSNTYNPVANFKDDPASHLKALITLAGISLSAKDQDLAKRTALELCEYGEPTVRSLVATWRCHDELVPFANAVGKASLA